MELVEKATEFRNQGIAKEQAQNSLLNQGAMFVDAKQAVDKVYDFEPNLKTAPKEIIEEKKVEKIPLENISLVAKKLKDEGKSPLDIKVELQKKGYQSEEIKAAIREVSNYQGVVQKKEASSSTYIWVTISIVLIVIKIVLRLAN